MAYFFRSGWPMTGGLDLDNLKILSVILWSAHKGTISSRFAHVPNFCCPNYPSQYFQSILERRGWTKGRRVAVTRSEHTEAKKLPKNNQEWDRDSICNVTSAHRGGDDCFEGRRSKRQTAVVQTESKGKQSCPRERNKREFPHDSTATEAVKLVKHITRAWKQVVNSVTETRRPWAAGTGDWGEQERKTKAERQGGGSQLCCKYFI